jgi:hypothetical protein
MIDSSCVGGGARKLVDQRFLRPLSPPERERLEAHLVSCAHCNERYRRLQLAERVAAGPVGEPTGPYEPSPSELERVAMDLGLLGAEAAVPRLWPRLFPPLMVGAASLAAMVLVVTSIRSGKVEEEPVARGPTASRTISFETYVVSEQEIRLHAAKMAVRPSDHLKFRASYFGGALAVALVPASGPITVVDFSIPGDGASSAVSVPGALSLASLPPGQAIAYLIAGKGSGDPIRQVVESRPSAQAVKDALHAAAVERIELEVAPP